MTERPNTFFGTNVLFEIKHKIDVKTKDNQNNSNNKLVEYMANVTKNLL
jgi:hypothetical protein